MIFLSRMPSLQVLVNLRSLGELNPQQGKDLGLVALQIPDDDMEFAHIKQPKTRWQIIRLCCIVCGIELCYAAETSFVGPTLLHLGVPERYMSFVWAISAVLGFFLVPLLGSWSDRCRLALGRRRPFILLLSLGIVIGLILIPFGFTIGKALGDTYALEGDTVIYTVQINHSHTFLNNTIDNMYEDIGDESTLDISVEDTIAETNSSALPVNGTASPYSDTSPQIWSIVFTILGVVFLDFCCDAAQSPSRAYMLDVCIPEDHARGLSTFTVLAGIGGALGFLIGGINSDSYSVGEFLGDHIKMVFIIVLIVYINCMLATVTTIREVPLERLKVTVNNMQQSKKKEKYGKFSFEDNEENVPVMLSNDEDPSMKPLRSDGPPDGVYDNLSGHDYGSTDGEIWTDLRAPAFPPLSSSIVLPDFVHGAKRIPRSIVMLCLTNFCSWSSLLACCLFFTDYVGQTVYGGDPRAPSGSHENKLYQDGVRMGSLALSLYSFSSAVYSMGIAKLVEKFGAKTVYILSHLIYSAGMCGLTLWNHQVALFVFTPTAGLMYAALSTMPYIILANYHAKGTFEKPLEGIPQAQKEVRGLGTDIALISSMVFIAQFLLAIVIGPVVHLAGSPVVAIVAAAILSFCGAVSATQVLYLDL